MPVNVSEKEFDAVASAALDAQRRNDRHAAETLDKLARKINAALTNANATVRMGRRIFSLGDAKPFTWRDVPSVLAPWYPKPRERPRRRRGV